jgi:hypothetical protein
MPKIKYDVSDIEDVADGQHAPVGFYLAKIEKCEPKESKKGNQMLECQLKLTHDAHGKKLKESYMPVWYYPIMDHDNEFVQARWREFILAIGLKAKGTLDTDKIVGQTVQVKLKSDTDQDGDYRPAVAKMLSAKEVEGEPEDEEDEDAAAEAEPDEAEDDDEEETDLDELSRAELKAFIKEQGLEVRVTKGMSDDDIRAAIVAALPEDDDEEEGEEDEEPEDDEEEGDESEDEDDDEEDDDDEAVDYSTWAVADLKKELKERELPINGSKKVLAARLAKDDGAEPF